MTSQQPESANAATANISTSTGLLGGVPWWGWVATIVVLLWAAQNSTLRPVIVLFVVVLILYIFVSELKGNKQA